MANVTVQGASYSDVPAVQLPQTGGGVCIFYEVVDGDNLSYGSAPLAGYAVVGSAALCEEESE